MKKLLFVAGLLTALLSSAATRYVDNTVSSSGNGQSWATAWKEFSNITGLQPGDVVYISGGASGQTYTVGVGNFVSASGTGTSLQSMNPITYKTARVEAGCTGCSGKDGIVTIAGTGPSGPDNFIAGGSWLVFDGNVNGASHMVVQGFVQPFMMQGRQGLTLRYVTVTTPQASNEQSIIYGNQTNFIEVDHCDMTLGPGNDRMFFGIGGGSTFTANLFHDSIFRTYTNTSNSFGDDTFQWLSNGTVSNNQFLSTSNAAYNKSQHQDGLQVNGSYLDIHGNYFEGILGYPLYGDDLEGGTMQHWRMYNNVAHGRAGNDQQFVGIGCEVQTCAMDDIIVANNTTSSIAGCVHIGLGSAQPMTSLTNAKVVNNLCYDGDNPNTTVQSGTGNVVSNNYFGTSNINFVNNTTGGDWHLLAGSTNAIGQGVNPAPTYLTNVYTTDKDGVSFNPNPWTIGAYTFNSGGGTPTASFSPTSLTFTSQNVNTSSPTQPLTLTNTGTAALAIASISLGGTNATSFFQSNNCPVGGSLGISSSCTITVTFTPLSAGSLTATITVTDSAADSPQVLNLSGTGIQQTTSSGLGNNAGFRGTGGIK